MIYRITFFLLLSILTLVCVNVFFNFTGSSLENNFFRTEIRISSNITFYFPFIGILFLILLNFFIEFKFTKHNTLKKLLKHEGLSENVDVFYLFFNLSGLKHLFTILLSFGLIVFYQKYVSANFTFNILDNLNGLVRIFLIFLVNTLLFYFVHRIMHTRIFWKLHEVHHSAKNLNGITAFRNHPVDNIVVVLLSTLPLTILGVTEFEMIFYMAINGLYQLSVHSNLPWNSKILGYIFITPQDHWLHHSKNIKYYNKNFGILRVWDQLFGTYMQYDKKRDKDLYFGLENDKHQYYYINFMKLWFEWVRDLFKFNK